MIIVADPITVIREIPDNKPTTAKQLSDYLRDRGWRTSGRALPWRARCIPVQGLAGFPRMALCRVRWGATKSRRAHWVLWAERKFWDPLAEKPIFLHKGGRVLSYMEIQAP